MSDCRTCINFNRENKKCKSENLIIMKMIPESLFRKCSDYKIDNEYFFAGDDI